MAQTLSGLGSLNEGLQYLSQNKFNIYSPTTGDETLTAARFIKGLLVQGGTPGAATKTTPTAAAIVAAIPEAAVGTEFEFVLDNGGDNTLTLAAGSGVTLSGTATCATGKNKAFRCFITNVGSGTEAVRVVCGPQLA